MNVVTGFLQLCLIYFFSLKRMAKNQNKTKQTLKNKKQKQTSKILETKSHIRL